jgi:hypothetical protein
MGWDDTKPNPSISLTQGVQGLADVGRETGRPWVSSSPHHDNRLGIELEHRQRGQLNIFVMIP